MSANAQDVIVKTDNSTILSKVEEISAESIKYRKWDNLDCPIYVLNISEVISINYSNGTMETFKDINTSSTKSYSINETTDSEFKKSYNLQFELYAKWLVGAKIEEAIWSNASPTYRIVKEVQKTVPEFWSESLAIIGIPGQYL